MENRRSHVRPAAAGDAVRKAALKVLTGRRRIAALRHDLERAREAIDAVEAANQEAAAIRVTRDAELGQAFIAQREPVTDVMDQQIAAHEEAALCLAGSAQAGSAAILMLLAEITEAEEQLRTAEAYLDGAKVAECNARLAEAQRKFAARVEALRFPMAAIMAAERIRNQMKTGTAYEPGRELFQRLEERGLYVPSPDGPKRPRWMQSHVGNWNAFPERAQAYDELNTALNGVVDVLDDAS
jgi:hypothetical protein